MFNIVYSILQDAQRINNDNDWERIVASERIASPCKGVDGVTGAAAEVPCGSWRAEKISDSIEFHLRRLPHPSFYCPITSLDTPQLPCQRPGSLDNL
jgi:hypothetical protein